METYSFELAGDVMRRKTGVVIPVYIPEPMRADSARALIRDNVSAFCRQVGNPAFICLSVDGEGRGVELAENLAREFSVSTRSAPVNKGKLYAAAGGMRHLLEKTDASYLAVADQDGDHFANELLNFVRAAEYIVHARRDDRVMILGQRISRHRPMGFLRGELEELADRILLDALLYDAAVAGRPLGLEFAFAFGEFPDFHSGYKLFSRKTAEAVFLAEPRFAGVSEDCYYRHACEAVMVVEALAHGACFGVVNRSTLNEQPISTFGLFERARLTADMIIWPCKRLNVPRRFVGQWMDNHAQRLRLDTLTPHGRAELERIKELVLAAFDAEESAHNHGPVIKPLFV